GPDVEPAVFGVGDHAQRLVAEVAVDVGVALAGPEVARALAADLDDLVGEHADVVAGEGVAEAVAEAAVVFGLDVGDPEVGPAHGGVVGADRHVVRVVVWTGAVGFVALARGQAEGGD